MMCWDKDNPSTSSGFQAENADKVYRESMPEDARRVWISVLDDYE